MQDEPRFRCFQSFHASLAFSVFVVELRFLEIFIHCFHCRQASHTFSYSCCFTLSLSFCCSLCQDPSFFSHSDGFRNVFDLLVFMISHTCLVLVVSHAFHVLSFPRIPRFLNCLAFSLSPGVPRVCLSLGLNPR